MKQTLYNVGKISKAHGYDGTLVVVADRPFGVGMEKLKEVFLLVDGIMTPFPIEEFVALTDSLAHVRLEFVSNKNETPELIGSRLYATIELRETIKADHKRWVGYVVHDAKYGKVGIIRDIEDYNGNKVMQVMDGKKEILISMYPELITGVDENSKVMYIAILDGYF